MQLLSNTARTKNICCAFMPEGVITIVIQNPHKYSVFSSLVHGLKEMILLLKDSVTYLSDVLEKCVNSLP